MKIRNGFVSNSSSTAFVILLDDLDMEQLKALGKKFPVKINGDELKSIYVEEKCEVRSFFIQLGILESIVKWTNII